jgi:hypothetical protein
MRSILTLAFVLFIATIPAAGQTSPSTYIGVSLIGEFAHFGGVDVDDADLRAATGLGRSMNGKTLGVGVVLGRALGERWGVEFEFVRGGTIKERHSQVIGLGVPGVATGVGPTVGIPPNFEFAFESEQRHTTFGAIAWARQELGARVDLSFLGGVSFNRVEAEQEITAAVSGSAMAIAFPRESNTVRYGVGPVVGVEAAIDIAEHVALTGGVRVRGLNVTGLSGWLVQPAAGLRWVF